MKREESYRRYRSIFSFCYEGMLNYARVKTVEDCGVKIMHATIEIIVVSFISQLS